MIAVQRHPGRSALAASSFVVALGIAAGAIRDRAAWGTFLVVALAVTTAVAEIARRATSAWARLAFVGLSAGWPAVVYLLARGLAHWGILAVLVAAGALPHVVVAALDRWTNRWNDGSVVCAAAVAAAALVVLPGSGPVLGPIALFGWFLGQIAAFHGATASEPRYRSIVLGACLFGLAAGGALSVVAKTPTLLIGMGAAWTLSALLVAPARIGRSFTAVPLDHPIYADFGGAPRRPRIAP
jgi:hypothetical protein